MSTLAILQPISIAEYLATEENAEIRHEYVDGYLIAMVGASKRHNLIAFALGSFLRAHLRGSPCRVFLSNLKVRVDNNFYYPDLLVACDNHDTRSHVETTPRLIVEVLSPSTEGRDRVEKRLAYQRLGSLEEYLLVAQDRPHIEVYRRAGANWEVETYGIGEAAQLRSLGASVPLASVYEDVDLDGSDDFRIG